MVQSLATRTWESTDRDCPVLSQHAIHILVIIIVHSRYHHQFRLHRRCHRRLPVPMAFDTLP